MLKGFFGNSEDEMDSLSTKRLRDIIKVLRKRELLSGVTPLKVRQVFEDLGPTFVKLGQIISVRPDILPKEYCEELVKLQSDVQPMDFALVKEIIQEEYNQRWTAIFASIDEHSLGSASIAQVHKAVLLDGQKVVIKVQRPGIYQLMAKDVSLLKRAVTILNIVRESENVLDLNSVVTEMWEIAKQEMDFLIEATHIEEFHHLNQDETQVECPKVLLHLTTQRILVMEYMEGIPLDNQEALQANHVDMVKMGRILGVNYVKQIIKDGFFHADPHPGNIYIRGDKILWLDLGMMGRLSSKDKINFRRAILAIVSHDTYELKEAILALGLTPDKVDHIQLYDDVNLLMNRYADLEFSNLHTGSLAREVMAILKKNQIGVPNGFSMFARGVLIMESVMERCCPQVNFAEIFAESLQITYEKEFDWRSEMQRLKRDGYVLLNKSMQLPEQLSDILKMTLSGQTKVNLDLTGSQKPLKSVDQMINKMIMAIISAALLLASSTICTTQMTPQIMEIPILGFIGYMAALILCSKLLWNIYKSDRRD